ncbi:unnamed protein product [Lupinus luteus]|uniref:Uncharacterized protein n=1 Tax=Lupinus luteus TaxID=3873 RepID=A0AAV1WHU9_LUPLU
MAHNKVALVIFIGMIIMLASVEDGEAIQISTKCPSISVTCYNHCILKCYYEKEPDQGPCYHDCAGICGCVP